MTHYADLAECTYFPRGAFEGTRLVAVGWLDRKMPFATGDLDPAFADRLDDWNRKQRFGIFLGSHDCNLVGCSAPRPRDTGEILVPHRDPDTLYVMPTLAIHYVRHHRYRPPQEFVDAVLATPDEKIPQIVLALKRKKIYWDRAGGGPPGTRYE